VARTSANPLICVFWADNDKEKNRLKANSDE